jgi:hypothetical protein
MEVGGEKLIDAMGEFLKGAVGEDGPGGGS